MDQCTHCIARSNLKKCEAIDCGHHENWYAMELKKMQAKSGAVAGYIALAEKWEKEGEFLAGENATLLVNAVRNTYLKCAKELRAI